MSKAKTNNKKKNKNTANKSTRSKRPRSNKAKVDNTAIAKQAIADKDCAFCPVFNSCGACQLLDVPYKTQCIQKQEWLETLFEDEFNYDTEVLPFMDMPDPFFYRNKVASPFVYDTHSKPKKGGKRAILTGMYAAHSHRLVDSSQCLLENKHAKQVVVAVKRLMSKYGIEPYNEDAGRGFMRHVIVRVGHNTDEVLVTLITNEKQFTGAKNFSRELVKACPFITTIVQNVNTRQTKVLLGDEGEKTLYGSGFILDDLCGLSFRISSHSFYQINAIQTESLYRQAIKLAGLSGSETVVDAYCGTGTIGLVAAEGLPEFSDSHAKKVIGFDCVSSAISDARSNAKHNGINNAEFIVGDAGSCMQRLASQYDSIDVVLMDPPRAGSDEKFLSNLVKLSPKTVVYISCNPQTQVRDIHYLQDRGYRLVKLQGVDMFPHTKHVESIAVLDR